MELNRAGGSRDKEIEADSRDEEVVPASSRDGEIVAPVGGTFEVSLEGTPAAGFVWEADLPEGQGRLVEQAGSEWRPPPERRLGGKGLQIFRFRALRPGEATLRFRYRRPWESHPVRERLVPVHIEDELGRI